MKKLIFIAIFAISLFATKQVTATEKGDFNMYLTTNLGHHSYIPGGVRNWFRFCTWCYIEHGLCS